jgi:4-alpha-glucanotransferase
LEKKNFRFSKLEPSLNLAAARALAYVGGAQGAFPWHMVRTAWASPADMAIAPFQDLLGLGSEARMNYPGTQNGWWS